MKRIARKAARPLARWMSVAVAALLSVALLTAQRPPASEAQRFQEAVTLFDVRGDYRAASRMFDELSKSGNRDVAARALVYLGACLERLGRQEARAKYMQVVEQYTDRPAVVAEARRRLAALDRAWKPERATPEVAKAWRDLPSGSGRMGWASSDGRFMAAPCRSGPCQNDNAIVILQLATGRELRRFHVPHDTTSALGGWVAPSPDGRSVACDWTRKDQPPELRIVSGGSQPMRTIFTAGADEMLVVWHWSTAGQILVTLEDAKGAVRIVLVSVSDGHVSTVATENDGVGYVSLSPDGQFVAFDVPRKKNSARAGVFVVAVHGGSTLQVPGGAWTDGQPMWTHDGRWLLFISNRTGPDSLCGIRWAAGRPRNPGSKSEGRFAGPVEVMQESLGRFPMPFAVAESGDYYYQRQTGFVDIFTVPLEADGSTTTKPRFIDLNQRGDAMMPALWGGAANGKLAFVNTLHPVLGIRDLVAGVERRVETGLDTVRAPRWFPDGRHVLVRGAQAGGDAFLHVIDTSTGQRIPIVLPSEPKARSGNERVDPRPGPLRIVYTQQVDSGKTTVRRFDIASRQVEDLLQLERAPALWEMSPADGSLALCFPDGPSATSLVVRDPRGATREVMKLPAPERIESLAWVPDGKTLFVVRVNYAAKVSRLWRINVESGEASPFDWDVEALREPTVSLDGRLLAFTAGQARREVWVASHFLPRTAPSRPAADRGRHSR